MDLIDAVIQNNVEEVRAILESGTDPNTCLDPALVSPLHFAAQHNSIAVVSLLITAGAQIHAQTSLDGQTPLDIARLHRHEKMARVLEEYSLRCQD